MIKYNEIIKLIFYKKSTIFIDIYKFFIINNFYISKICIYLFPFEYFVDFTCFFGDTNTTQIIVFIYCKFNN